MTDKLPTYSEATGWRYDTEHSMLRRMASHDYQSRCIYMLTLTQADRSQPLLGGLSNDADGEALLVPSPLGECVREEWVAITKEYPQISIIRVQLMPEHLHVVLFIHERLPLHLGKIVGKVKNRCNKHYWRQLTERGLLAPKGQETPPALFSENFQDTILSHGGQLEKMIRYVDDNPKRAMMKRMSPELFKIVRELKIGDRTFAAIGNAWLLNRPVRMQVRCHNNSTPQNLRLIAAQKEYFLERGRKGGVVVSPCISAGEKEIARAALDAKQPLIVILENGFPPLYKPPGKYFEACAAGLLLMLAPWPYHTERRTISRWQCNALNGYAAEIATEPWTVQMEAALSTAAERP